MCKVEVMKQLAVMNFCFTSLVIYGGYIIAFSLTQTNPQVPVFHSIFIQFLHYGLSTACLPTDS